MINRFQHLTLILSICAASGCTSIKKTETESTIRKFEDGKMTVLASCEFYNSAGDVIRRYPGDICVPVENGDLYISTTTHLTKLNRNNQVIWSKNEPVHHQMKMSFNKKNLYFISGYYEANRPGPIRQDIIKVIDTDGRTLHQFDFADYLKTLDSEYVERYRYKNTWSFNGTDQTFFEYTHINSIDEIVSLNSDGKPQLDGYVVNDRSLGKVFFFDSELKLNATFDFDFEAMHDVSLLDQNTLIYFLNSNRENPFKSRIETFDLKTRKKTVIYGNAEPYFYSKHNGGVQPVLKDLFLISHAPKPSQSYVELISKRGEVLKRVFLRGSRKLIQDAELRDYGEFLKNNIGN